MDARKFFEENVYSKISEAATLEMQSADDPEDDPYCSMYMAREILKDLKGKVTDYLGQQDATSSIHIYYRLYPAYLAYQLAINYIETEEAPDGEKVLDEACSVVEGLGDVAEAYGMRLAVISQKGCLWSARRDFDRAKTYLDDAMRFYLEKKGEKEKVICLAEFEKVFSEEVTTEVERTRAEGFEEAHTHTLYYLAQVYTKYGDAGQAADYCQQTLQRQLSTHKYGPLDWSLNAATLSQYYITQDNYPLARHCLAASELVLEEAVPEDDDEGLRKARADLHRCWVKYCLALLETSKERLMEEEEGKGAEGQAGQTGVLFDLMLGSHETQITADWLLEFEEARNVFKSGQTWCQKSKEYYSLNDHCTDFIEVTQDHSRLFFLLAFFEPDMDRQCRMHKRRADMLLQVNGELSPQHYLAYCRALQFEAGEIFSGMYDIKVAILEASGDTSQVNAHALQKLNKLATQSIEQYTNFLESFRKPDKSMPDQFDSDDLRPVLIARFYVARLCSKLFTAAVAQKLENMLKSLEHYEFIVDYVKRWPDAKDSVPNEIGICREMVQLMPLKMEKVRQQAEDDD